MGEEYITITGQKMVRDCLPGMSIAYAAIKESTLDPSSCGIGLRSGGIICCKAAGCPLSLSSLSFVFFSFAVLCFFFLFLLPFSCYLSFPPKTTKGIIIKDHHDKTYKADKGSSVRMLFEVKETNGLI